MGMSASMSMSVPVRAVRSLDLCSPNHTRRGECESNCRRPQGSEASTSTRPDNYNKWLRGEGEGEGGGDR